MSREFALREKFVVEIDDNVSQAFMLAVVLAIDAIHNERVSRRITGGGGMFGSNFP